MWLIAKNLAIYLSPRHRSTDTSSGKLAKQGVLIVDDESGSRRGLAELVASWGYAAETAADGAEALEKVASFRPQVVIVDLVMPRMDGMELLRALSGSLGYLSFGSTRIRVG